MKRLATSAITLLALITLSAPVYAQKSITLLPKGSKLMTNNYGFTVNATCSVQGHQARNKIRISVLQNQGTVNGKHLSKGQATSVTLTSSDSISVSAEPGMSVNLMNMGSDRIQADCSV